MNLRTFKAPTLKEARKKAVDEYGSRFIILESRDGNGTSPAQVTVGIQNEAGVASQPKGALQNEQEARGQAGSQPVGKLFEPFVKQFGNLVAGSTETLKALSSGVQSTGKTQTESGRENGSVSHSADGVTFERSLPQPAKPSSEHSVEKPDPVPDTGERSRETIDFRQHYRRPLPAHATADVQIGALSRKIGYLEKLIMELNPSSPTGYASESWYRELRQAGFTASLLDSWAEKASARPAFTRNENDSEQVKSHLYDRIDSFFTPRALYEEHPFHLFSSLEGTDTLPLIRAIFHQNKRRGMKTRVALLFSSQFDLDEQGLLMIEMLSFHKIEAETIVSHRDWERLLETRHEDETILAAAIPLHMDHEEITGRWEHLNRILGERHSVKHHLVVHAIHNPEAVCSVLPSGHPFAPDYISLTHFGSAGGSMGNLAAYRDCLQCPFGYLHHLAPSDGAADTLFSNPATSLFKTDTGDAAVTKIAG
jgi:hypothetical protein